MPKMKTNKAVAKRIKVTRSGKVLRRKSGSGHLKSTKTPSRRRRFRKDATLSRGFARIARKMIGK